MDTDVSTSRPAVHPAEFARRQPVIAGIDGSRAAIRAAEWAAAEARSRQVPLRLIAIVPAIDKPAFRAGGSRYRYALEALAAARRAVLARYPDTGDDPIEITREVRRGQAEHVLVELSRSAALIALGSTDIGFFAHLVLGSTTLSVTRDARCPVALVRPAATAKGDVLVVVTDWHSAEPALTAAFRAAHERGADLVVARVWPGRAWSDIEEWGSSPALVSDAQIRHCQRDFPEVRFRPVTVVGDVATAVERFSATAQLVVVTHDVDAIGPARLGRVAQDLVCHSSCPVLVLPGTPAPRVDAEAVHR
ncbi:universal stress protein [Nocardia tengchongensis]|uniref:universal stress protein n=1 Tax=Nocardia tengchongensis TaxID=2055889 RepID=UPI003400314D